MYCAMVSVSVSAFPPLSSLPVTVHVTVYVTELTVVDLCMCLCFTVTDCNCLCCLLL